jgi:hypothetical protein
MNYKYETYGHNKNVSYILYIYIDFMQSSYLMIKSRLILPQSEFEFQNVVRKILKFFGCELKITKRCHEDFNLLCINYNTCYTSLFLVKSDSHLVCFTLVG